MVSPQKHDEQRGARDHIQLARQPLASQAGDDPKPEDVTTEAATSGGNPADFEAGLAARQDAFQGSNAEPGGPASGNPLTETIARGLGGPTVAGTTPEEFQHTILPYTRTSAHFDGSEDVGRGPIATPGVPVAEHPPADKDLRKSAIYWINT